jgi:hypothetical protein
MPPAARVTDMHVCALVNVLVPHVGGPILPPCMPTVLIGGLPAARVTDMAFLRRAARRHREGLLHRAHRRVAGRAHRRPHRSWRRDRDRHAERHHRRGRQRLRLFRRRGSRLVGRLGAARHRRGVSDPKKQAEALKQAAKEGLPFAELCS